MSSIKITEMPEAGPLTGTEVFEIVQDGANKKLLLSNVQGAVESVNDQIGEVVLSTDDISEGNTNKYLSSADKAKLDGVEEGAQVNTIESVNSKTGAVSLTAEDVSAIPSSEKGVAGGVASLGEDGKVPSTQLPEMTGGAVDSVNDQTGAVVLNTDNIAEGTTNKYYPTSDASKLAGIEEGAEVNTVDSVNGYTGVVELSANDVGAISDAPVDGSAYNRKDGAWVVAESGSGAGSSVALDGPKLINTLGSPETYTITNYSAFSEYVITASAGELVVAGSDIKLTMGKTDPSGDVVLTITQDGVEYDFVVDWQNPSAPPSGAGVPYGGGYYAGANIVVDGVEYYLVVAPKGQGGEASSTQWKTELTSTSGADSKYDGRSNTAAMISAGASSHPAAEFCNNLDINGFSDWHLPSKDELEICYRYLKPTTSSNGTNWDAGTNSNSNPAGPGYTASDPSQTSVSIFMSSGGEDFPTSSYHWASTETGSSAYYQRFINGVQGTTSKTNQYYVRAVRWVEV